MPTPTKRAIRRQILTTRGEVLPPSGSFNETGRWGESGRWSKGGHFLDDDRLEWLEILLDEAFAIPGTSIRFGIDGIVAFIPGVGDILAGLLSLLIPVAAWIRGVPYITMVRMLTNVTISMLGGAIPIFGDAFVIFWKANKRNYRLLTRSIAAPRRHTWRDWLFLSLLGLGIGAIFATPLVLVLWLIAQMLAWRPFH